MKNLFYILVLITSVAFSQNKDDFEKARLKALQQSNNLVYEANELASEDYVSAEMKYREALSKRSSNVAGAYNLGNSYYNKEAFEEALYRYQEAAKKATSRDEKHKAFHNIGNILMRNKKCKEAVEAYKNALRNNPKDDESRYNLALAKECAKDEGDGDGDGEDENEDEKDDKKDQNEDENKEDKDKDKEDKGEDEDKPEDEGDQEKKDGDKDEDKDGKPQEDEKDQQGEGDKKEQQNPQPKPGQLSPQQVKNLLEAMNDQEQKVQEKINAKKQKGAKIKTDKDW